MSAKVCLNHMEEVIKYWPPRFARVLGDAKYKIYVTLLYSGTPIGPPIIMAQKDGTYFIESIDGFTETQIQMMNDTPSFWFRIARATASIYATMRDKVK